MLEVPVRWRALIKERGWSSINLLISCGNSALQELIESTSLTRQWVTVRRYIFATFNGTVVVFNGNRRWWAATWNHRATFCCDEVIKINSAPPITWAHKKKSRKNQKALCQPLNHLCAFFPPTLHFRFFLSAFLQRLRNKTSISFMSTCCLLVALFTKKKHHRVFCNILNDSPSLFRKAGHGGAES